jgi:hypothetical protein
MSVINAELPRIRRDQRHRNDDGDVSAVNPSVRCARDAHGIAYFMRDDRLLELATEDWRLNAGLGPNDIREAALRDVGSEEVRFVTGGIAPDQAGTTPT